MSERMNELKPGDPALVIGCCSDPSDIGKLVRVVELLQPGDYARWVDPVDGKRPGYSDEETGPAWLVTGDLVDPEGEYGYAFYDPKHLMALPR